LRPHPSETRQLPQIATPCALDYRHGISAASSDMSLSEGTEKAPALGNNAAKSILTALVVPLSLLDGSGAASSFGPSSSFELEEGEGFGGRLFTAIGRTSQKSLSRQ